MNQNLRTRHRSIITVVAIITPIVFAAALITRPQMVSMESLPVHAKESVASMTELMSRNLVLDGTDLATQLFQDVRGGLFVQLTPKEGEAFTGADVLVYWHGSSADGDSDAVPPDAFLVGTLAGSQTRVFSLPTNKAAGRLMFYSLAQKRKYDYVLDLSQ